MAAGVAGKETSLEFGGSRLSPSRSASVPVLSIRVARVSVDEDTYSSKAARPDSQGQREPRFSYKEIDKTTLREPSQLEGPHHWEWPLLLPHLYVFPVQIIKRKQMVAAASLLCPWRLALGAVSLTTFYFSGSQNVVPGPAAASPRSCLETQTLRPQLRPTESDTLGVAASKLSSRKPYSGNNFSPLGAPRPDAPRRRRAGGGTGRGERRGRREDARRARRTPQVPCRAATPAPLPPAAPGSPRRVRASLAGPPSDARWAPAKVCRLPLKGSGAPASPRPAPARPGSPQFLGERARDWGAWPGGETGAPERGSCPVRRVSCPDVRAVSRCLDFRKAALKEQS
ncbi:hypothetical protein J1605_019984 [Eschrichtius robustus]|uniref:Uncharacterized protein n=1 Tax=Eschrichtius robustus TaxID=9764 RepID=A0AB34HLV2_ESCRO|nr:hypothetical protein J1605_019984 [Eschrichtius robustus]